jgi:hypothetical protein
VQVAMVCVKGRVMMDAILVESVKRSQDVYGVARVLL